MPVVKIHELPQKDLSTIKDTDIFVIEDNQDTKYITVEQLREILGNTTKLANIQTQLTDILNEIHSYDSTFEELESELINRITNTLDNISSTIDRINNVVINNSSSISKIKNSISTIEQNVGNNTTNISNMRESIKNQIEEIKTLKSDNSENKNNITNLSTTVANHTTDISDINQSITDISGNIDTEINRIESIIMRVDSQLQGLVNSKYDGIMDIIDYYHHIHQHPPNWDEPYKADPVMAEYIHPVGSIYQTQDKDFKPSQQFPGEWKYCGKGVAVNDDGDITVQYYTWIRES